MPRGNGGSISLAASGGGFFTIDDISGRNNHVRPGFRGRRRPRKHGHVSGPIGLAVASSNSQRSNTPTPPVA